MTPEPKAYTTHPTRQSTEPVRITVFPRIAQPFIAGWLLQQTPSSLTPLIIVSNDEHLWWQPFLHHALQFWNLSKQPLLLTPEHITQHPPTRWLPLGWSFQIPQTSPPEQLIHWLKTHNWQEAHTLSPAPNLPPYHFVWRGEVIILHIPDQPLLYLTFSDERLVQARDAHGNRYTTGVIPPANQDLRQAWTTLLTQHPVLITEEAYQQLTQQIVKIPSIHNWTLLTTHKQNPNHQLHALSFPIAREWRSFHWITTLPQLRDCTAWFAILHEQAPIPIEEQQSLNNTTQIHIWRVSKALAKTLQTLEPEQTATIWYFPALKTALLWYVKPQQTRYSKPRQKPDHHSWEELLYRFQPGDYVIHLEKGLCEFIGIRPLRHPETQKTIDTYCLRFAHDDLLYCPVWEAHLLIPYHGKDKTLRSLRGRRWLLYRQRVIRDLEQIARHLLEGHARRKALRRPVQPIDLHWLKTFQKHAPYTPTQAQKKIIRQILRDMQKPYPMDRLLTGDAGYGKTEIMLYASVGALARGDQILILTPTTLLAFQHWQTFRKRLAPLGVHVACLSRLQTPTEQQTALKGFAQGSIDVLIGTHALLYRNVQPAHLGLVIIDEEHRFGVNQKDQWKMRFPTADFLLVSATPIPRTLQMSISGIQDISILTEAPYDRPPEHVELLTDERAHHWIQTLQTILNQEGQALVVAPRIRNVHQITTTLQQALSNYAIEAAHGKLPPTTLRQRLEAFFEGKIAVLVATAIVGAGLDFPHVRTLFLWQPERFGIADLYQLRGRVGRRHLPGRIYLIVPNWSQLQPSTRRRLKWLVRFRGKGAGFQLALQDLQARGSGPLFAFQQHGHLKRLGLPVLLRLFEETVRRIKAQAQHSTPSHTPHHTTALTEPTIETNIEAHIPSDWIPEPTARHRMYLKLNHTRQFAQLTAWCQALPQPLPQPVQWLITLIACRLIARTAGIKHISLLHSPNPKPHHNHPLCFCRCRWHTPIREDVLQTLLERVHQGEWQLQPPDTAQTTQAQPPYSLLQSLAGIANLPKTEQHHLKRLIHIVWGNFYEKAKEKPLRLTQQPQPEQNTRQA